MGRNTFIADLQKIKNVMFSVSDENKLKFSNF